MRSGAARIVIIFIFGLLTALETPHTAAAQAVAQSAPRIPVTANKACSSDVTSFRRFGAVGDGVADDAEAIQRAVNSGCKLTGEGRKYKVTRTIRLIANSDIRDATFLQAIPRGGLIRTLYKEPGGDNVKLTKIKIDRGSDPFNGTIADAGAIWISGTRHVELVDIEVYGDGPGRAILLADSDDVHIVRPYIHDMQWATDIAPARTAEQLAGITLVRSKNVTITAPRIRNLWPTAVVDPSGKRGTMADGIGVSGVDGLTITNADISLVGEGIDMSGKLLTKNFVIADSMIHDVDAWCYKTSHFSGSGRQGPGVIRNSTALRCGLGGFVLDGPVENVELINDKAIDTGSNGYWRNAPTTGFTLVFQGADRYPTNIRISGCDAVDTQKTPTMKWGFRNQSPGDSNSIVDSTASGFTEGAYSPLKWTSARSGVKAIRNGAAAQ